MKHVKMIGVKLNNFRRANNLTLAMDGADVDIYGDNGTGKTTIADGLSWLLYGQDSRGNTKFEIKTLDVNGKTISGRDGHSVSGVFEVDGKSRSFKKVYAEQHTKRRGAAVPELTGHMVEHFVDGVPVKAGEYKDAILEIAELPVFQMLTDPLYFAERLSWQERRKVLLSICGDLDDDQIIAGDQDLSELPAILGGRSIEAHTKVVKARRSEINAELDQIPARIDEKSRELPDVAGIDVEADGAKVASLNSQIEAMQGEIADLANGGPLPALWIELAKVEADLLAMQNEHNVAMSAIVVEKRQAVSDAEGSLAMAKNGLSRKMLALEQTRCDLEAKAHRRASLLEEWRSLKNEPPIAGVICDKCGQELPADQVEEIRARNLESRSKAMEANKAAGLMCAEQISQLEAMITGHNADIVDCQAKIAALESVCSGAMAEFEAINERRSSGMAETPEYLDAVARRESLVAQIQDAANDETTAELIRQKKIEIDRVKADRDEANNRINLVLRHGEAKKRVDELQGAQRTLAAELNTLERQLFVMERFTRARVSLLNASINDHFRLVRWKMFSEQVNGGIAECCEATVDGVPYGLGLNTGSRINAGLDIINTLSRHYGLSLPIIIDNAESITSLEPVDAQIIRLVVSEQDAALRFVIHRNENEMEEKAA